MGLVLNEEQRMLQDSAREMLSTHAPVSTLRELRDSQNPDGFSRALWTRFAELGWTGMMVPESHGGSDFGFQGLGVAFEEAGRTLAASPLLATVVLGGSLVRALGNDEQCRNILPGIVNGDRLLALAIDETPRHQPQRIETEAVATGSGYRLNGRKTFVLDGHVAGYLLVVARTAGAADDPDGLSVFVVPRDTAGLQITRTRMVDSRNAAKVELTDVELGADTLLGPAGAAGPALERTLDLGRVALSAEMLGGALEAFERTIAYLKMREQFGVLIGTFQSLKHRAAEMFSELELTRSAVYAALGAVDEDTGDRALLASLAKAQASKTYELVTGEAVQMHGGIGMTDDEEIGFFLKRARVASQTFGDVNFHRDRYARLSGF